MSKECEHGLVGYCYQCVQKSEHLRCFERFEKSGNKSMPEEGVGFQP